MNTDEHRSVFIRTTNVRILVRRSRIFSPRRREEREEMRFQRPCVLRVFAVDFWGCGWAALCSSVVSFFSIRSHWRGGMYVCHHIPDETCRENLETGHKSWARISSSTPPALVLLWRLFADCFRFSDFLPHPILPHDRSAIEREHLREHVQNLHGAAPRFRGRCPFAK